MRQPANRLIVPLALFARSNSVSLDTAATSFIGHLANIPVQPINVRLRGKRGHQDFAVMSANNPTPMRYHRLEAFANVDREQLRLVPASAAVPAAAAKQQNDDYDDEKRVGIHL